MHKCLRFGRWAAVSKSLLLLVNNAALTLDAVLMQKFLIRKEVKFFKKTFHDEMNRAKKQVDEQENIYFWYYSFSYIAEKNNHSHWLGHHV